MQQLPVLRQVPDQHHSPVVATAFAEAFAASLLASDTLGVAGRHARRTIEDPADPSRLAYTIYGSPNAVATFGK